MPTAGHVVPRLLVAIALVVAVVAHAWLVNDPREMRGGLLSFDDGGHIWSNSALVEAARENGSQDVSSLFSPAGKATFGLGLLAAALLVGTALVRKTWLMRVAVAAHGLALGAGVAFITTKPTGPAFGIKPGWAAIVFVAAALGGAFLSSRTLRES